jgi:hypothetical protein
VGGVFSLDATFFKGSAMSVEVCATARVGRREAAVVANSLPRLLVTVSGASRSSECVASLGEGFGLDMAEAFFLGGMMEK